MALIPTPTAPLAPTNVAPIPLLTTTQPSLDPPAGNVTILDMSSRISTTFPNPLGDKFDAAQLLIMAATMTLLPVPTVPPLPLAHYDTPAHDTMPRFINLSIAYDDILTTIFND